MQLIAMDNGDRILPGGTAAGQGTDFQVIDIGTLDRPRILDMIIGGAPSAAVNLKLLHRGHQGGRVGIIVLVAIDGNQGHKTDKPQKGLAAGQRKEAVVRASRQIALVDDLGGHAIASGEGAGDPVIAAGVSNGDGNRHSLGGAKVFRHVALLIDNATAGLRHQIAAGEVVLTPGARKPTALSVSIGAVAGQADIALANALAADHHGQGEEAAALALRGDAHLAQIHLETGRVEAGLVSRLHIVVRAGIGLNKPTDVIGEGRRRPTIDRAVDVRADACVRVHGGVDDIGNSAKGNIAGDDRLRVRRVNFDRHSNAPLRIDGGLVLLNCSRTPSKEHHYSKM